MEIVKEFNKILHKKLEPIKRNPKDILELVSGMKKKMYESKGIGLAANQVGLDIQMFVIDEAIAHENKAPSVYINPEITSFSREKDEMEEGCLSIPGYWVQIPRSKKIMIKAMDEHGNKFKFKARGMLARILQHEHDHLQGVLIKDRVKK